MLGSIATNEASVFEQFLSLFKLEGSSVLEIGGCLPEDLVRSSKVKSWTSVDPLAQVASTVDGIDRIRAPIENARLVDSSFDFVFSCNAFEHINELGLAMQRVTAAMKPGGRLFSHFGPIWSGPDGHHIEDVFGGKSINFWEPPYLPHWCHLAYSREELKALLETSFSSNMAEEVADWVFQNTWTNKLYYEDYLEIFSASGLQILDLTTSENLDYDYKLEDGYPRPPEMLARAQMKTARPRNLAIREICVILGKL
ncbi:methyltransferase domain-containing protein [Rhizobium sp. VS19-DR104.2]|uniref:class I SAM-dependent methyltransferase n=1 Tax=unclassified Rhizobium TaxID=2613769 RepID=UPI001CC63B9C|nr:MULTISPECIES: methyltransferase domain-containing protein [unclassified Rhizobium]MBZ5763745.1 methyltransferase domain-containing protein [Rhizobium sp. VS19-DR96]MBZ5769613.1 methyltransferase domain-containing protein [Rhizobium sp. VS19-DR129.2]MBZ5776371.1 methyltransferase domain-containing protein [Rhizobium sp. VS19-DRK62.2]MBZ5787578.1 methyltransferase domain-containing protein [Rhizobium sp. VS19-DR121]MBZ5804933.1 methyltransferase domain-containing protein [Rhizobium sp. VS19-D